jgi:hypothetical protein
MVMGGHGMSAEPFLMNDPITEPAVQVRGPTSGSSFNVKGDQAINYDRNVYDIIINPQTPPSAAFLNTAGAKFQFNILPDKYRFKHLSLEFDVTNTDSQALQATQTTFWLDRYRILSGSGSILQECTGEQIWAAWALKYNQERRTSSQSLLNVNASTFAPFQSLAAGATQTFSIPLDTSFLVQNKLFVGSMSQSGLQVELIARGPAMMINTGAGTGIMSVVASRLRVTSEWMSTAHSDELIKRYKEKPHLFKFLDNATQSFSQAMTAGILYNFQLQSLNGLSPFAFFTLRQSLTGAGLSTYTAIKQYELKDQSNVSLQGGQPMPDIINRGTLATENFPSDFLATQALNPMLFVDNPIAILDHVVNVGSQSFVNNFLNILAASTATVQLDVYIFKWSSLIIDKNGCFKTVSS